jgi:5-deoxy-glucuronate isomerase
VTAAARPAFSSPILRRGEAAKQPYSLEVTPEIAGWDFGGLRVLELAANERVELDTGEDEMIVLPLNGGCIVVCDGEQFALAGRDSVFSRVTDFAYAPRDAHVEVYSERGGRFALPAARATRRLQPRYGAAEDVAVELRGAGHASRQVNNFCSPEGFAADRLIAVEVLTPGGNWSSYPPHKHDVESDRESALEEIYYFEIAGCTDTNAGLGYQRVYSSGAERAIDVCTEVGSGDVVLIPYGYHGPSMAAPGYDLYYLNVMAGPGERVWRFCDDPDHAWIRASWEGVDIDPRLPLTSAGGRI